jgi:hypothetical protein
MKKDGNIKVAKAIMRGNQSQTPSKLDGIPYPIFVYEL